MSKALEYYRALPYTRRAEPAREGEEKPYWVAWVEELPGCKTDGATMAEAVHNLDELFDEYIEAKLEWGADIPEPRSAAERREVYRQEEGATAVQGHRVLWEDLLLQANRMALSPSQRVGLAPGRVTFEAEKSTQTAAEHPELTPA